MRITSAPANHPTSVRPLAPPAKGGRGTRTWKTGPRAGPPNLGPAAQSLLDRGRVRLETASRPYQLMSHLDRAGRTAVDDERCSPRRSEEIRPYPVGVGIERSPLGP